MKLQQSDVPSLHFSIGNKCSSNKKVSNTIINLPIFITVINLIEIINFHQSDEFLSEITNFITVMSFH